jgi:hypothetical protein
MTARFRASARKRKTVEGCSGGTSQRRVVGRRGGACTLYPALCPRAHPSKPSLATAEQASSVRPAPSTNLRHEHRPCLITAVEIPAEIKLIPACSGGLIFIAPGSSRASSIAASDDGARWVRRQRALGGAPGGAAAYVTGRAHPEAAIPGDGDIAVGAIKRTLARSVWGLASPWRLPALHPLFLRGDGKRDTGRPAARTTRSGTSGALASATGGNHSSRIWMNACRTAGGME